MSKPLRIVSLLSAATEILYGLGLGEQLVAVSHECDYPSQVSGKPRVTYSNVLATAGSADIDHQVREMSSGGAALYGIDTQQLVELQPDLVITQAQCDVCAVRYHDVVEAVQSQPQLHSTRILTLNPNSLQDIFQDILHIAAATDRRETADHYLAQLRQRIANVRGITDGISLESRPRVACIEWIEPIMLAGNWVPELVALAGGRHDLTESGQHSPYVPWQQIVQYDPQVIVVAACGFDLQRTLVEAVGLPQLPGWRALTAVRDRRVYAVDGNAYFNRSGPRIVDSVEILAHLFHPLLLRCPDELDVTAAWQRIG